MGVSKSLQSRLPEELHRFLFNGYSNDEVAWPTPQQTVQGRYRSLDGAVDHGIV
jgi:hypothetical protein